MLGSLAGIAGLGLCGEPGVGHSGRRSRAEPSDVPHERVRGTDEDHSSSPDPESRGPRTVLTNRKGEQQGADKDAEGRDQSADAVGHLDIIDDNLGLRE